MVEENLYLSNSEPSVKKEALLLNMQHHICMKKMALQKEDGKQLLP